MPDSPPTAAPAVTGEQFLRSLQASGLIPPDQLQAIISKLSPAQRQDARQLTQELVRQQKLTWYQAAQLSQGKTANLVLGNYVLLDQVGAGGMGQVYKARHRRMDRIVALKVLSPAITQKPEAVQRFQREVKTAAKLTHPNIVTAYDADEAQGTHFLVMEFVEGTDLAKLVKKQGPLPVGQAVDCIIQAARGLAHAHTAGIVHRDIKPHNLLLSFVPGPLSLAGTGSAPQSNKGQMTSDKGQIIKVLDLGLARIDQATAETIPAELTASGGIMGTCDYMAPEQAVNPRLVDHRADIYALGSTLYFLLTGKPMYRGETSMEKLMAHQNEPIPSLRANRSDVPDALESVYRQMAAKRPDDRYSSMPEVIAALQAFSPVKTAIPLTGPAAGNLPMAVPVGPEPTPGPARKLLTMMRKVGTKLEQFWRANPWRAYAILSGVALLLVVAWVFVTGGPSRMFVEHQANWVEKDWIAATVKLPAAQQADAVRAKIKERNPNFDSKETYEILEGKVVGVDLRADDVPDLSPLRALPDLKRVTLRRDQFAKTKLSPDLAPLRGLPLESFDCSGTLVADLSPLKGMSLTILDCHSSRVTDLSPLKGMPLTNLDASGTGVADLSPLKGMPLKSLNLNTTRVTDLTPLEGMQLTYLGVGWSNVSDLSPLKGMPLTRLDCTRSRVSDLTPLKGMPLRELGCDLVPQRDAAVLRSITTLQTINNQSAAQFWQDVDRQLKKP